MRLAYVVSYVADVTASLEFYERAFGLRRRYLEQERHYAELVTGETTLAFVSTVRAGEHLPAQFQPVSRADDPVGFELTLLTEDVTPRTSARSQTGPFRSPSRRRGPGVRRSATCATSTAYSSA